MNAAFVKAFRAIEKDRVKSLSKNKKMNNSSMNDSLFFVLCHG